MGKPVADHRNARPHSLSRDGRTGLATPPPTTPEVWVLAPLDGGAGQPHYVVAAGVVVAPQ